MSLQAQLEGLNASALPGELLSQLRSLIGRLEISETVLQQKTAPNVSRDQLTVLLGRLAKVERHLHSQHTASAGPHASALEQLLDRLERVEVATAAKLLHRPSPGALTTSGALPTPAKQAPDRELTSVGAALVANTPSAKEYTSQPSPGPSSRHDSHPPSSLAANLTANPPANSTPVSAAAPLSKPQPAAAPATPAAVHPPQGPTPTASAIAQTAPSPSIRQASAAAAPVAKAVPAMGAVAARAKALAGSAPPPAVLAAQAREAGRATDSARGKVDGPSAGATSPQGAATTTQQKSSVSNRGAASQLDGVPPAGMEPAQPTATAYQREEAAVPSKATKQISAAEVHALDHVSATSSLVEPATPADTAGGLLATVRQVSTPVNPQEAATPADASGGSPAIDNQASTPVKLQEAAIPADTSGGSIATDDQASTPVKLQETATLTDTNGGSPAIDEQVSLPVKLQEAAIPAGTTGGSLAIDEQASVPVKFQQAATSADTNRGSRTIDGQASTPVKPQEAATAADTDGEPPATDDQASTTTQPQVAAIPADTAEELMTEKNSPGQSADGDKVAGQAAARQLAPPAATAIANAASDTQVRPVPGSQSSARSGSMVIYPYEQLKGLPGNALPHVDAGNKENHLEAGEFLAVLGISRPDFGKLPKWKQTQMKKAKDLF